MTENILAVVSYILKKKILKCIVLLNNFHTLAYENYHCIVQYKYQI